MSPSELRSPLVQMMLGIHPDDTDRYDAAIALLASSGRGRGQPKKTPARTNDAKRALLLYFVAERIRGKDGLPRSFPLKIHMRTHIVLAKALFPKNPLLSKPNYHNKMLASVKRGRRILGIDEHWRGPPVEDLLGVPF